MSQAGATGYSGKPVWQKLGLTPHLRVRVRHAPSNYAELVGMEAAALTLADTHGAADLVHIFATSAAQLATEIHATLTNLPATGVIWVSWPKKSAGIASDLGEDGIRALVLPLGLVDIKVCAIDATWSGLKLMWRRELRSGKG